MSQDLLHCSVCGVPIAAQPLMLSQDEVRTFLCSFECVITFAVSRIRERHNTQIADIRERLRAAKDRRRS